MKASCTLRGRAVCRRPRSGLRLPWIVLVLAGCLAGGVRAQPAEGVLVDATFRIDLGQVQEGLPVAVRYRLRRVPGVDTLPLKGVLYRGAAPEDLVVVVDDAVRPVLLDAADRLLTGFIPLAGERPDDRLYDPVDTLLTLDLRYVVPGPAADTPSFDYAVPVLYVDWVPEGAPEGLFTAEVRVPDGVTLTEVFPTVPPVAEPVEGGRRNVYRLQVVPSLIRLRGYRGEQAPLLTVPRLVDLLVLLGLGVLTLMGWRVLRRGTV